MITPTARKSKGKAFKGFKGFKSPKISPEAAQVAQGGFFKKVKEKKANVKIIKNKVIESSSVQKEAFTENSNNVSINHTIDDDNEEEEKKEMIKRKKKETKEEETETKLNVLSLKSQCSLKSYEKPLTKEQRIKRLIMRMGLSLEDDYYFFAMAEELVDDFIFYGHYRDILVKQLDKIVSSKGFHFKMITREELNLRIFSHDELYNIYRITAELGFDMKRLYPSNRDIWNPDDPTSTSPTFISSLPSPNGYSLIFDGIEKTFD